MSNVQDDFGGDAYSASQGADTNNEYMIDGGNSVNSSLNVSAPLPQEDDIDDVAQLQNQMSERENAADM